MSQLGKLVFKGVFRPRLKPPGFGIPLFANSKGLWVQELESDRLVGFARCTVDEKHIFQPSGAHELVAPKPGAPGLYAFQFPDGSIQVGVRSAIAPAVNAARTVLESTPFVLQDVAEFLQDKELFERAWELTHKRLAALGVLPESKKPAKQATRAGGFKGITVPVIQFSKHKPTISQAGVGPDAAHAYVLHQIRQGQATRMQIIKGLRQAGVLMPVGQVKYVLQNLVNSGFVKFEPGKPITTHFKLKHAKQKGLHISYGKLIRAKTKKSFSFGTYTLVKHAAQKL